MDRIAQLRKLSVKLDVSGTATTLNNTKLYKDSFGLVSLQCYVPITQVVRGRSLCTAHRSVTDINGRKLIFNQEKFNMLYVGKIPLGNIDYLLFECLMPKSFTDIVGELEIVFNYTEADKDGKIIARLTSNTYRTYVEDGGADGGDVELNLKNQEAAQINANTIAIETLISDVENLFKPPDVSEADRVGIPEVSINEQGNLKFSNIKGEQGKTGSLIFPITEQKALMSIDDIPGARIEDYFLCNVSVLVTFAGAMVLGDLVKITAKNKGVKVGNIRGPQGYTGKTGDAGAPGRGVFAVNVEDGDLVLYTQDVEGAEFSIRNDGYLIINLN